jgi:GxxExxY protein
MNRRGAEGAEGGELGEEMSRQTYAVIGAAMEVHRKLGPGYLESVYQNSLEIELRQRGIPFEPQKPVEVRYRGYLVGECRVDFVVAGALLVELKAVQNLAPIHEAQVISYLKITGLSLALLINFNVPVLKEGIRRIILSS